MHWKVVLASVFGFWRPLGVARSSQSSYYLHESLSLGLVVTWALYLAPYGSQPTKKTGRGVPLISDTLITCNSIIGGNQPILITWYRIVWKYRCLLLSLTAMCMDSLVVTWVQFWCHCHWLDMIRLNLARKFSQACPSFDTVILSCSFWSWVTHATSIYYLSSIKSV